MEENQTTYRSAVMYMGGVMYALVLLFAGIVSFEGSVHAQTSTDATLTPDVLMTNTPHITSVTSSSTGDTSVTITWVTDVPSNSQVAYGSTTEYSTNSELGTDYVTNHSVSLTGLDPNVTYHFHVISFDQNGNGNYSDDQTFSTSPPNGNDMNGVGNNDNGTSTSTTTSSTTPETSTTSTTTTSTPVISSIDASSVSTGSEEVISWTTDVPSTSQVAYGSSSDYSIYSILDNSLVTDHSLTLSSLEPGTTYHFQVISTGGNGNTAYSLDRSFVTFGTSTDNGNNGSTSTSTTGTTTSPAISSISATAGDSNATITWSTNVGANAQVRYGVTSDYTSSTTMETMSGTDHSVILTGLSPNTTYHFQVVATDQSGNQNMSDDMTFTTESNGTGSSSATSTSNVDLLTLRDLLLQILSKITIIEGRLGGGSTTTIPTPGVVSGTPSLTPTSISLSRGGSIDFNGRNFGAEETVRVTRNGLEVGTVHADGGGNFSTGSMSVPTTVGTNTYTFTGAMSGVSRSATVQVTQ